MSEKQSSKLMSLFKNFTYTVSSNMFTMITSIVIMLVVPKIVGGVSYGYFQLYTFYVSYVGFLHFGWNDGIYLRYGGEEYEDLDKTIFSAQFFLICLTQMFFFILLIVLLNFNFLNIEVDRVFILIMTGISMVIINLRYMLLYIVQATNKIKQYANIIFIERFAYIVFIIVFIYSFGNGYKPIVIADLAGKLISLLYALYCCKDLIFNKISFSLDSIKEYLKETYHNISVGIKLMFSNIASSLILGVVRFSIERDWSISVFGKVSLSLSISNFLMTFINTIGIVLYPILRRTNPKKYKELYGSMRVLLSIFLVGILLIYYPLKSALIVWLPEYSESLFYLALLFPICIFEGKMSLLVNTFLKTLRKEKIMLFINIISLVVSILVTIIVSVLSNNITITILIIVIVLAFRSILGELILSKILKTRYAKSIILELIMATLFILVSWNIDSLYSTLLYFLFYIIFLILNFKELLMVKSFFKNMRG